jgi:hypothetical protein
MDSITNTKLADSRVLEKVDSCLVQLPSVVKTVRPEPNSPTHADL